MKHKEQGPSGTKANSEKLLRRISFFVYLIFFNKWVIFSFLNSIDRRKNFSLRILFHVYFFSIQKKLICLLSTFKTKPFFCNLAKKISRKTFEMFFFQIYIFTGFQFVIFLIEGEQKQKNGSHRRRQSNGAQNDP